MAENMYLDLSITVACERYNLDETDWTMFSFTDGSTAITVALENTTTGAKVRCSFPREEIRFEEMKRWDEPKKLAFLRGLFENGHELPNALVDSFSNAMLKLDLPSAPIDEDDSVIVEVTQYKDGEVVDVKEETAEEFEAKVEGRKVKKFKRKAV